MDKRDLIYQSSIKVIANKGFHGTTVKDIVVDADVSVGTFYNYFRDKDSLLIYIYSEELSKISTKLNSIYISKQMSCKKLNEFIDFIFDRIDSNIYNYVTIRDNYSTLCRIVKRVDSPALMERLMEIDYVCSKIILQGQEEGIFKQALPNTIYYAIYKSAYECYESCKDGQTLVELKDFLYNAIAR